MVYFLDPLFGLDTLEEVVMPLYLIDPSVFEKVYSFFNKLAAYKSIWVFDCRAATLTSVVGVITWSWPSV